MQLINICSYTVNFTPNHNPTINLKPNSNIYNPYPNTAFTPKPVNINVGIFQNNMWLHSESIVLYLMLVHKVDNVKCDQLGLPQN